MKKILIPILALLAAAAMLGCVTDNSPAAKNTPDAQQTISPEAQTPEPDGAVATPGAALQNELGDEAQLQLFIKQKTVMTNAEDITLIIINGTDGVYTYDYVQRLERKGDDGNWQVVPLTNEAVSLALLTIPAGETQEQAFDLANHYDELTRGTYRIVKTFVGEDGAKVDVNCEFDAF